MASTVSVGECSEYDASHFLVDVCKIHEWGREVRRGVGGDAGLEVGEGS